MIRINLLPHRKARQRRQILQHLLAAAATVALAVVFAASLHVFYTGMLSDLQDEEGRLITENQALKKKIGKIAKLDKLRAEVQAKLDGVEKLQKGRFRSLETLIAFSRGVPENVWLKEIKDEGGRLSISGFGESNRAVARFMRALEHSALFGDVQLKVIKRSRLGDVPVRKFDMLLKRVNPASTASGKEGKV